MTGPGSSMPPSGTPTAMPRGTPAQAPPRRGHSVFWPIAGMFLLVAVVGTLLQGIVVVAVLQPLETREVRARAELAASSIDDAITTAPRPLAAAELESLLARHRPGGIRGLSIVYQPREGAIASAPADAARFLPPELGGSRPDSTLSPPSGERSRFEVIARRTVMRNDTPVGEVRVIRRIRSRGPAFFPPARTLLLFLPIAIAVSLAGGFVMVRVLVGRLRSMEMLAGRIAKGDLSVRIDDRSGDEIGRLAQQLDRMTDRLAETRAQLEGNEQQRRQLFADITHELATPLTSIRGYAETLLDPNVTVSGDERTQYVRGLLDESSRLDRLIRDLFELARLEAGSQLAQEPLDWAALCRNTLDRFEPRFRKAGLRVFWCGSAAEAWIDADGRRIEQVLDNLLVNALRYVPHGGTVELRLERDADRGRFRLVVSDDGPGLPVEELPHVFERFYRGARDPDARDHSGSGLGLAIVKEIIERHGGTVAAKARAPQGLTIEVEMPARATR